MLSSFGSLGIAQTLTHTHDWSWGRGDDGYDSGEDIAVSDDDYNYTTGVFSGTVDFHPYSTTVGSVSSNGAQDVYICKRDANGQFEWVRSFGGTSNDDVVAIDVDSESNVYVTGRFYGTVDFDPSSTSSFTMTQTGSIYADVYVCKLDENGNFVWAKQLNGNNFLLSNDLFVDDRSDVHIVGAFKGQVDVNPNPSPFGVWNLTTVNTSTKDGFSVTLDENGIYKKSYHLKGTASSDVSINAIYVDHGFNQLMTGDFTGTCDFDRSAAVQNQTSTSSTNDIFIMRVDPFNGYEWAEQYECTGYASAKGIELGTNNYIYTTGIFKGSIDLGTNNTDLHVKSTTRTSSYISKLTYNGLSSFGKTISGTGGAFAMGNVYTEGISVTDAGQVFVAGYFDKTIDFNPGASTHTVTANGTRDAFILGLDVNLNYWTNNFIESHYTNGYARNNAIDLSEGGDIYTTGRFTRMVDCNPSGYAYYLISLGGYDMFTHKLEKYVPVNPFSKSAISTVSSDRISVYPNPTTDFINIELDEEADVMIYSMTGNLVFSDTFESGASQISLDYLSNGTYIVHVVQGNDIEKINIVKQ